MHRRQLLAALGATAMASAPSGSAAETKNSILELKTWLLHNSPENQPKYLNDYLKSGLQPALQRAGVHLAGVFTNVFGAGGPYVLTVVEYASWEQLGQVQSRLLADSEHAAALKNLPKAPFVRVESSLLRSFDVMPQMAGLTPGKPFVELRTYESPSFPALARKVGMFNEGEAKIFERLGHSPVFFGECLVGPRQPNLSYMLSYESLAARDLLWQKFVNDPEWKKLSSAPELKDSELVVNISNVILHSHPL